MLTSSGSAATVDSTPGDTDSLPPEETILTTVTELAARWHRHADTGDQFVHGMRQGWAQAISLLLGADSSAVLTALQTGAL